MTSSKDTSRVESHDPPPSDGPIDLPASSPDPHSLTPLTSRIDPDAIKPTAPDPLHTGQRQRDIPLASLQPGDRLPPRDTWLPGLGQLVLAVVHHPNGHRLLVHDYDAGETYEHVSYDANGVLPCPRRRTKDQVPETARVFDTRIWNVHPTAIDWTLVTDRVPLAGELQEGDLLPPRLNTEMWRGKQQVVRVSMVYDGRLRITTQNSSVEGGSTKKTTFIRPDEPASFPRDGTRSPRSTPMHSLDPIARVQQRSERLTSAPVLAYYRSELTGQVFRFVGHPYTRGRWPREIPEFQPYLQTASTLPVTCRPPRAALPDDFKRLTDADIAALPEHPPITDEYDLHRGTYASGQASPALLEHTAVPMPESLIRSTPLPPDTAPVLVTPSPDGPGDDDPSSADPSLSPPPASDADYLSRHPELSSPDPTAPITPPSAEDYR